MTQIILIATCSVLIIVAAVVWIGLAGTGSIPVAPSSSSLSALNPTSSLLADTSSLSSNIPSTETATSALSSVVPPLSSVISSGNSSSTPVTSIISTLPEGVTITPQEDIRFENAPGPNSAGDGVKRCYLTFDDGPSSKNTKKVLNILDQYNVKATFFVISTSNLSNVKDAYDRGHAIGLHANSHEYGEIYRSSEAYFNDLETLGYKVKQYLGFTPNIIRFPGGSSNTVSRKYNKGIMTRLAQEVETRGYYYFDWNVDSTDASGNNVPASKLISEVKKYVVGQDNVCILMHDTDAKGTTVEALPQIIEYCRSKGYEFCILNKYAPGFHHGINN